MYGVFFGVTILIIAVEAASACGSHRFAPIGYERRQRAAMVRSAYREMEGAAVLKY